ENYLLSGPTGNALHVTGLPQAMEMSTCPGLLGIVGAYVDNFTPGPGNSGVFFMHILPGGIPGPIFNFTTVAGSGFDIVDLTGLKKSPTTPGDWYLTGTARDPFGILKAYAMRFNECSGAMVWSQIYDIPGMGNTWGRDIEENLVNPFGFPGAAIVGQVFNGGSNDAYLIHIDATTGFPAPHPVILYGTPVSNEEFRSIRQAPAGPFPPGFILGGYSNVAGNVDFLVIRMDPVIAPLFMNLIDYSFAPGTDNYCYDVIHRLNSLCQDEYYAVGNARAGQFGGADVMAVKMDQFGVGVAGGEFIYGGPGNDFGTKIDQRTMVLCGPPPPNFDGITIFGSTAGSFPTPG
ncbi:MAG TPA: hypothetical protein VEC37_19470, partial [Bacillota bacterium]|nr:hypothetical protein [Bacillota bacterium]